MKRSALFALLALALAMVAAAPSAWSCPPGYYGPRYYVPPPIAFDFRFGDRGWHGRHLGHHWR